MTPCDICPKKNKNCPYGGYHLKHRLQLCTYQHTLPISRNNVQGHIIAPDLIMPLSPIRLN